MTDGHPYQSFGGRTYAQHGEDLIFLNIFDRLGVERPSYLDIGAHHPVVISNTALLYARGSRGINVEANPNLFADFRKHRPADINLCVGVAASSGRKPFYMAGIKNGRNSFVRSEVEPFGIKQVVDLDVTTVGEIVDRHARGLFPDLLSIDAEGADIAILRSIDFSRTRPKVICAEVARTAGSLAEAAEILAAHGFAPAFRAGSNMIFVHGREWWR